MRIFGHRDATEPGQGLLYAQIRSKLDTALTSIFTEDGKRAVLYYMTEKYSLTLEQASQNPARLEDALTSMLGEIGWIVVKRKILEQFYPYRGGNDLRSVESASLRDAFGLVSSIRSLGSLGPKPHGY